MTTIRTVIVDDEQNNIEVLQHMLTEYCPQVAIAKTFRDPEAAVRYLAGEDVGLLFLDVQMPGMTGFELLERLDGKNLNVIFVTAYDTYAIKAIRYNALDYLLKPIDRDELVNAVEKYTVANANIQQAQVAQLKKFKYGKQPDTIALSTSSGLIFLKLNTILYLEGQGSYSYVHDATGGKHLVSKNLSTFEEILCDNESDFFRPHKSFLINLSFVKQYIKGDGGEIIMTDNKSIILSRLKKQEFLDLFSKV